MGKTIIEKIFSNHSNNDVYAGELVIAKIDFVFAQDGTAPLTIKAFEEMQRNSVFNPEKVVFVIDHSVPSPIEGISKLHKLMHTFSKKMGFKIFDIGEGVCHQLIPEQGYVVPGDLVVGADSHTCTYGAINAFSTGMGSTDIAAAIVTGKLWFKVPETIKIVLNGKLPKGVYAKDIILYLIGQMNSDGATYKAVEFTGDIIKSLSIEARFTICNMAIEMGAKAGIMEPDDKCLNWVREHSTKQPMPIFGDTDAKYEKILNFDLSNLEPQISKFHTVDNVFSVSKMLGTKIHQAFLGTCTNGRLEDLRIVAKILKNRKKHKDVKFIIAPASKKIYLDAIKEGILQELIEAGGVVVAPGCGCCVGTHNGIPADNENVLSTANRNFKGRMGNKNAFIYLSSPATIAASVIKGEIADPREYF